MTHQDLHPSPPDLNSPDNGITIAPSRPTFSILTGLSSFLFTWIMKEPLVLVLFGYTLLCNFLPRKTRVTIYCQHNNLHMLEWRSQTLTSQVFISIKTLCLRVFIPAGLDHTPSLKDSLSNPPQCLFLYYFLFSRKSFHLCLSKCNLSPRHLKYFIS